MRSHRRTPASKRLADACCPRSISRLRSGRSDIRAYWARQCAVVTLAQNPNVSRPVNQGFVGAYLPPPPMLLREGKQRKGARKGESRGHPRFVSAILWISRLKVGSAARFATAGPIRPWKPSAFPRGGGSVSL